MNKAEFKKRIKNMLKDAKDGYYGMDEITEEVWSYIQIARIEVLREKAVKIEGMKRIAKSEDPHSFNDFSFNEAIDKVIKFLRS